jgi:hypothetical protein
MLINIEVFLKLRQIQFLCNLVIAMFISFILKDNEIDNYK